MSHCRGRASRRLAAAFIAAVVLLGVSTARAGTFTWNGGDVDDDKWTSGDNWGGVAPGNPAAPDDLVFAGSTRVSPDTDGAWSGIQSIGFTNAAAAFTLAGDAITFTGTGAVSNTTAYDHTINNNLVGGATALNVTQNAATKQLTFGGTIDLSAGGGLNFTLTAGTTIFNGIISGGAAVNVNVGAGIVQLNADNTYSGVTTLTGGKLVLGHANGAGTGTINLNGGGLEFNTAGSPDFDNAVTATLSGNLIVTQDATLSGVISGAGGTLGKSGAGTLTFTGDNNYTGGTTVNAGTLVLGHAEAAGAGAIIVNGGNLELNTAGSPDFDNTVNAQQDFDLIVTQDATLSGVIGHHGPGVVTKSGAGTVTFSGDNTYSGGTTVTAGTLALAHAEGAGTGTIIMDGGNLEFNTAGSPDFDNLVTATQAFDLTVTQDATLSGVISGAGAVTKSGAGTLTFSGDNDYSGGTTVTDGTLALGYTEGAGTGTINMNGGDLEFNTAGSPDFDNAVTATQAFDLTVTQDATLSGVLSGGGAGVVTKAGAGTVTFSGDNDYSGGTTVTAGTLALGHAEGAGTGTINMNGGNLEFNTAGSPDFDNLVTATQAFDLTVTQDATLSGAISGGGAGVVTKAGAGTVTFSGNNDYSGGTTVTAGTLALGHAEGAGTGTIIMNGGDLEFNTAGTPDFDNAVTATQDFDLTVTQDATLSGAIGGAGAVTKAGAGTVTFSGANTYAGATTVNAGTLVVNGSLGAGLVTIEAGTTLGGSGQIGGSVLSRGTTAPGNSIDTLVVDGDYTLAAGGTLDVEVERAADVTDSDLVDVGGTAILEAGSTVRVTDISAGGAGNVIQTNDTFTVVAAVGGVDDQGATVTDTSALLNFTSAVVGTDYILTAHQVSTLAAAATGGNNGSVAAAIDADAPTAAGDYGTLINNLLLLPAGQLDAALAQLGGQAHMAAGDAVFSSASQMTGVLTNHLGGRRTGATVPSGQTACGPDTSLMLVDAAYDPFLLAQVIDRARRQPEEPAPAETTTYFFAQPFGDFYIKDTTANQLGYRANTAGIQFGMDRLVSPHALVGLSGGYGHTEVDVSRGGGGGRIDTFRIGPYASLFDDRAFVDAAVSYGAHWNEMHRKMLFGGINRTAESDYVGHDMTAYLGGGYRFNLGACAVTPNGSAQYTWYRRRGFSETGAGAANLTVDPDTSQSMLSRLGLSISRVFTCKSVKVCPEAFGGWWHEYLGDQSLDAHFAQGVARFRTERAFSRDGAYYGAGVSVLLQKNVSAYVRWQGTVSNLDESNAVIGGVGVRF